MGSNCDFFKGAKCLVNQLLTRMNGSTDIPAAPSCCLVKQQPRERAWMCQRGKEDPVEIDCSLMLCSDMLGVEQVGGKCQGRPEATQRLGSAPPFSRDSCPKVQTKSEIPLPSPSLYSLSDLERLPSESGIPLRRACDQSLLRVQSPASGRATLETAF